MGNETSRDYKHDLGDVDKPDQFHRVLVEPAYSVLDPPILTKLDVLGTLVTQPASPTTSTSDTCLGVTESVEKETKSFDDITNDHQVSHYNLDSYENQIQTAAKEIVDQVVNNALTEVNNETKDPDATVINGDIRADAKSLSVEKDKESPEVHTCLVAGSVASDKNSELGEEETTTTHTIVANGEVASTSEENSNAELVPGQSTVNNSIDEAPAGVKVKEKKTNKVKISKSKKAEKHLRERELIDSVKDNLNASAINTNKTEKGKSFMKMFKFSKRKLNVDADISPNVSDVVVNQNANHVDGRENGISDLLKEIDATYTAQNNKTDQDVHEHGTNVTCDISETEDSGSKTESLNMFKDTKSIDSGVVVDKATETQVDSAVNVREEVPVNVEKTSTDIKDIKLSYNDIFNKNIEVEIDELASSTELQADHSEKMPEDINDKTSVASDLQVDKMVETTANMVNSAVENNIQAALSEEVNDNRNIDDAENGDRIPILQTEDGEQEIDDNSDKTLLPVHLSVLPSFGIKDKVEHTVKKECESFVNGEEMLTQTSETKVEHTACNEHKSLVSGEEMVTQSSDSIVNRVEALESLPEGVAVPENTETRRKSSKDSSTTEGSTEHTDMPVKIKKKSWSFQIRSSKKKVEGTENEETKDKTPTVVDGKKPNWILGKLSSLRKSNSDVSAFAPNLNEVDEGDSNMMQSTKDGKKKSRLKMIKDKIEKRKESNNGASVADRRSFSHLDIALKDNTPGSRRSIVEDDVPYTQTDAFAGVDLSDLSADEETQVSNNPSRHVKKKVKESKMSKAKGLFKMNKRKAPGPPETDSVKEVTNTISIIEDGEYAQIQPEDVVGNTETEPGLKEEKVEDTQGTADVTNVTAVTCDVVDLAEENVGDIYAQIIKKDRKNDVEKEQMEDKKDEYNHTLTMSVEPVPKAQTLENNPQNKTSDADVAFDNSPESGHSNPLHEDDSFISKGHESVGISLKPEIENKENDAYVRLEHTVSEQKSGDLSPDLNITQSNTNTITEIQPENDTTDKHQAKNSLNDNSAEQREKQPITPIDKVSEIIKSIAMEASSTEPKAYVKSKPRVVIMKEVGVQAPDIHMPLDIERDFGFYSGDLPKVSVGIQVSDGGINQDDCDSDISEERHISKCSIKVSPAFF